MPSRKQFIELTWHECVESTRPRPKARYVVGIGASGIGRIMHADQAMIKRASVLDHLRVFRLRRGPCAPSSPTGFPDTRRRSDCSNRDWTRSSVRRPSGVGGSPPAGPTSAVQSGSSAGKTSTGLRARLTSAWDTLPSSDERRPLNPREPTTITAASRESAASRIVCQIDPRRCSTRDSAPGTSVAPSAPSSRARVAVALSSRSPTSPGIPASGGAITLYHGDCQTVITTDRRPGKRRAPAVNARLAPSEPS